MAAPTDRLVPRFAPRLTRRTFCAATGSALCLAGCGVDGGGFRLTLDGGSDGEVSAAEDLSQEPPPDLSQPPPDMAGAAQCSGKVIGPLAASLAVNQAVKPANATLFVCRDAQGIYAVSNICTHSGCAVTFRSMTPDFYCGCHVSIFDFNGARLSGPANRPLPHYACCLDGQGRVVVDTTRTVAAGVRI